MVKGLRVKFGDKVVIDELSFELKKGVTLLLGPNGSGKTTLLRTLIGMIKPDGGELFLERGILSYSPSEFFSPQMKTYEVLTAGKRKGDYDKYVKLLGIERLLERDFYTLSSGEKRLVLVAKALSEGNLVLMDEPFSYVDFANKYKLVQIINQLRDEKQFLIAVHELEMVNYADEVIVLNRGRVNFKGRPELLTEELLSSVYNFKVRKLKVGGMTFFTPDL